MEVTRNAVGWFEIPVNDMERAIKFYETVFEYKLERHQMGPLDMAWFPFADIPGAPGTLVFHKEFYKPTAMVYLFILPVTQVTLQMSLQE
jgi:predicted enzyme related to lactoylglutathione lyase